jgi:energy-converting hydrogenase Eha subunit E
MRPRISSTLRYAALLAALVYIVIGIMGLVGPTILIAARQNVLSTPAGHYAAGAARVVMGLVLVLVAPASRAPKILRVLGVVLCVQGLAATFASIDRARAILEFEALHAAYLPIGAVLALASGCFIAFAIIWAPCPWSLSGNRR